MKMSKLKNIVANIPIYVGMYIRELSDSFFVLGFRLHITFKTESGIKLKEIDEAMKKLKEYVNKTGQAAVVKKASGDQRYSKLAEIIKGNKNDSSSDN
jgi:hypothetical protein